MMQLHQDQSLSRDDKMAKAKSLHADTTGKIEAVLTADQKQKYEAMQQKMQERMQERMQGGGAPPAQSQIIVPGYVTNGCLISGGHLFCRKSYGVIGYGVGLTVFCACRDRFQWAPFRQSASIQLRMHGR